MSRAKGAPLEAMGELPTAVRLSIVIPCLNEEATLGSVLAKARLSLERLGISGELIVADNGSSDRSREIAVAHGARVVDVEMRGYGSALLSGIAASQGEFVIMGDADDTYDLADLQPFVAKLDDGYDIVIGNRFSGGISPGAMPFLHRYLGTPVLTWLARILFKSPLGDINCGLRGFRKTALDHLNLRSTGMEFASEMIIKASLNRLRIAEVPTTLSPSGRDREPHLRTWRDGWRHLRFLLLYSPSWLFLYPGIGLMIAGSAAMIVLLPGPLTIGSVVFDVHTLLFAALAVIIGYQAIVFSFGAKIFGVTEGLIPEDPRLERLLRHINLEVGLLVGVLLCLAGLAGSGYALARWGETSFGQLDYRDTLRIVIPSWTVLAVGSETVLGSFFFSILGLRRR